MKRMFRFETVKSILFILVALCVIDLNAQGKKSLKSYVIAKTLKSSCSHPPVITCPLNFSSCPGVNTSPSNTGTATAVPGGAGCGQPIVTYSDVVISIGPCNGAIEISRTWTARDPQDPTLSSSCVQNIRLRDITAPVITNCPANITVAANSNCAANVTWNPPTVTDNCGRLYLTVSHISGDRFPIGVTTVTYTAEDLCLNSSVCSFTITVTGQCCTVPPIISCPIDFNGCPLDTILPKKTGTATAVPGSSSCGTPIIVYRDSMVSVGPCVGALTMYRIWTARDPNDTTLRSTCKQKITLADNIGPSITNCPANVTVSPGTNCQAQVSWNPPTINDNCKATLSSSHSSGSLFNEGTTTVTLTATDLCGHTATCSFTVTVTACCQTNPVITCPPNYTSCPGTSSQPAVTGTATAVSGHPNCAAPLITYTDNVISTGPCTGATRIERTWKATNPVYMNLFSTCVQVIELKDIQAPTITNVPANLTVAPGTNCQAQVSWNAPTINDNCGTPTLTSSHASGSTFNEGTTTVTLTVTDNCGNSTQVTFTVTVSVCCNANPIITCPSNYQACPNSSISPSATGVATAVAGSPNCGVPVVTYTDNVVSTGPCAGATRIERTWKATDPNKSNLFATCIQVIELKDVMPPTISNIPANITVAPGTNCQAAVSWNAPAANDNCTMSSLTSTHASGSLFNEGVTTVTYTATDGCGNSIQASFTVTVTVCCNSNPIISCPPNYNACPSSSTQPSHTGIATAVAGHPSCGVPVVTYTDQVLSTGPCAGATKIQRTWKATDPNKSNLFATCVQIIELIDNNPPTLSNMPANLTVNPTTQNCQAIVTWNPPIANDNCQVLNFTSSHSSGSLFNVGTTTVTYTVSDFCGNSVQLSFTVTVLNNCCSNPPNITCPPNFFGCPTQAYGPGNTGYATATASNPSCGTPVVTYRDSLLSTGPCALARKVIRIWKATDPSNSSIYSTCHQTIELVDNTPPVFTSCPPNMTVNLNGDCQKAISWQVPTFADNCSTSTIIGNYNPGHIFGPGVYTITYVVQDVCGRSVTHSFTLTVIGGGLKINCPANINVTRTNPNLNGALVSWTPPSVTTCGACQDSIPGFMYIGTFNNHKYFCSLQPANWINAKAHCESVGGYLCSMNSTTENNWVASKLMGQTAYIGLHDSRVEGLFEWVDKGPLTFTNWYPGQPNNANGDQDYVELLPDGTWNDQYPTCLREYICEVPCYELTQIGGPANGTLFPCGTTTVTYLAKQGNLTDTCRFTVTVDCNTTTPPPAAYCDSRGLNSQYMWIQCVNLQSLNNCSGNNGGYANFSTANCAPLNYGNSYNICLTPGFAGTIYNVYWRIWIDYNADGDFEDPNEFVAYGSGSGKICGYVTMPGSCVCPTKNTRMRVSMAYGGYPGNSCCVFSYGEVEDYCITLVGSLTGEGTTRMSKKEEPSKLNCVEDCDVNEALESLPKLPGIGYGSIEAATSEFEVNLYPNPVQSEFTLSSNVNLVKVEVIDLFGKIAQVESNLNSRSVRINASNLPNGQYIVNAISADGTMSKNKFNVQH